MTSLPDLPENAALLALLRSRGVPQEGGDYAYEGWELHTHPDLLARLNELAPHSAPLPTFGVPVLATRGVAAVAAWGTDTLLLRLPSAPVLERAAACPPLTDPGQGWYAVSAWQSELSSAQSARLLTRLVSDALVHAAALAGEVGTG